MSISLKGRTVLASFAVQPVASETESERYFDNHYRKKFTSNIVCEKNGGDEIKMVDIQNPGKRPSV